MVPFSGFPSQPHVFPFDVTTRPSICFYIEVIFLSMFEIDEAMFVAVDSVVLALTPQPGRIYLWHGT